MAPQQSHPHHHHHHYNSHYAATKAYPQPYSIPNSKETSSLGQVSGTFSSLPNSSPQLDGSLTGSGPPVTYLSRRFVARRISEGETGRLKEELKCQACGKGYKHITSLAKHLWEHTPEWNVTSKLSISKHQQVKLLEAASILVSMNEEEEQTPEADSNITEPTTTDTYAIKLHQDSKVHNRRKSISKRMEIEDVMANSPQSSPSLADDSSTPSPPPQPLTPRLPNTINPIRSNNLSNVRHTHSRSSSLSSPVHNTHQSSSTAITDSLYVSSSLSSNDPLPTGMSPSSTRYNDVVSADTFRRRLSRNQLMKPALRRPSTLNPPSKVNTRLILDSEDEDNESAVVDDLDDGVFGEMD